MLIDSDHRDWAAEQSQLVSGGHTARISLWCGAPRIPQSLMAGLLWGKIETFSDFQHCMLPSAP